MKESRLIADLFLKRTIVSKASSFSFSIQITSFNLVFLQDEVISSNLC
jgi:hypothetical protein